MGLFERGGRLQAIRQAVAAEAAGTEARWPSGEDMMVLRDTVRQLHRSGAQVAEMTAALKETQQMWAQARVHLELLGASGLAMWMLPALSIGQPAEAVEAHWSEQCALLFGENASSIEPTLAWLSGRVHQEDLPRLEQFLSERSHAASGQASLALRARHRSGSWRWIQMQSSPASRNEDGQIRLGGTLTDITEQRETDQYLDITLTRFELGARMLNDGLWDMSVIAGDPLNPSNEFWWSEQFRNLLGFEGEHDFPNVLDSWASRLHPDDKDRALGAFAAHLTDTSGRTPFDLEYRLQRKDGTYRWYRARGLTKRAADGTPLRAVGALLDIDAQVHLSNVVSTLNGTAAELVHSNQDLSQRTEQQASALEETASSMEEMTTTVQQNADGARRASTLASEAASAADTGQGMVAEIVTTMAQIEQSASRIADIIGVIDGIAFQTNILALNAAVEAARAGEQGRGFAVVATEVRALAQRCTAAAKEIKELIQDSVNKVSRGSEQTRQAGARISALKDSVAAVDAIVADIAAASVEQSAGISQINQGVIHMDSMTQQNAALVEEMAASVNALRNQAALLEETARSSSLRAS